MIKLFQSRTNIILFILLMFIPLLLSNVIGMIYFGLNGLYPSVFFIIWESLYLLLWLIIGLVIYTSITTKIDSKDENIIIIPTEGKIRVVRSGGHKYSKEGSYRPQNYIVCDTKPNDIHVNSGIVSSANDTDELLSLREIDVMHQIDNKLYLRGYLQFNKNNNTYYNKLDLSSIPAELRTLYLELNQANKNKEGLENLYSLAEEKLIEERKSSLINQSVFTNLFTQSLEKSNIATGNFSGTNTAIENRRVDAKLGSTEKIYSKVDEKLNDLEKRLSKKLKG